MNYPNEVHSPTKASLIPPHTRRRAHSVITAIALSFAAATSASADDPLNHAASANGGVASQSSIAFSGSASRAIDGGRSGHWSAGSVTHTGYQFNAWWQSQFADPAEIHEVLVFNRTDCCVDRINPFSVFLYLGDDVVWSSTGNTFTADIIEPDVAGMTFTTGGVVADRVMIQLDGTNFLSLAEVEAWGTPDEPDTSVCGDLDGDGDVDHDDMNLFFSAWGSSDGDANYIAAADLNDDGVISMADWGHWVYCYQEHNGN